MKKFSVITFTTLLLALLAFPQALFAARGDVVKAPVSFSGIVVADGFKMPWNVAWGPDDMIWITERMGRQILRIDPATGEQKVVATISQAHAEGGHEGILGMAFSPDFRKESKEGLVYICYTYRPKGGDVDSARKRIVRYSYNQKSGTLGKAFTILDAIPAGDDHNAGRMVIGPDRMLYLSLGDLGHNQGANITKPNFAQRLPTQKEVNSKNYIAYAGKVLRIDVDKNGAIPNDNPTLGGVRSHVYTYGHRNPQGLVFIGDKLFSSDHGPSVDDEINLLVSGGNYGWPHVAGYRDNKAYHFVDWSQTPLAALKEYDPSQPDTFPESVVAQKETDWNDPNYVDPLKTFYTVPDGYNFGDDNFKEGSEFIAWPTIAPSSLGYYPANGPIPGWENSLLMTTLKTGRLYRLKLNSDKKTLQGDVIAYFDTQNRYRDVCLSPDGKTIYIITDSAGSALGTDGRASTDMKNPGALIAFTYSPAK